jgi:hypothetical protein
MQITNETVALLWLGAGAVALWMFLPAVLNALGLTFRQSVIDYDALALEPAGNDAEYEDLYNQLRRLRFEPVGTRSTSRWLYLHHWYRNHQSRVFAARQGDAIALAYKLWAWDQWRLSFVTAFSDGAIVETANQMESLRIDEPDYLRWGLSTPDRAFLLERHREVCPDFAAAGSRSAKVLPADEVNRLIGHHESRNHRKRHRFTGLKFVSISLGCLLIGLLLVRWLAGTAASYLLPISIIAWGFLWPAFQTCLLRAAASSSRADDARAPRHLDGGALQEQRIVSNEENDEHAKSRLAKTRMRFKVTVVCIGMIMAAIAYAIKMHLGDPFFTVVQTALLTYLAIVIAGFFLDLIIFRSK